MIRNIKWKSKLGKGIRIEIKVIPWPFTQYWTKVRNHRYHEGSSRNIMIINIKWRSKLGKGIRIEIKVRPWPFTQYWTKVRNHRYHEGSSRNIMIRNIKFFLQIMSKFNLTTFNMKYEQSILSRINEP